MQEIDFMTVLHKSTKRNYLERVNDIESPKSKAAKLAKKFDFDYWDGDRRICYGGYRYIEGRWEKVALKLMDHYKLNSNSRILDIGCGKGYLLYDLKKLIPGISLKGIDISKYALENSKEEVRDSLTLANASDLPYPDNYFDLVISINTLHCLHASDLNAALKEMERVSKKDKYLCVESYKTEEQKTNLLYWQVTCEAFHNTDSWKWLFSQSGYTGDYSFIFFD